MKLAIIGTKQHDYASLEKTISALRPQEIILLPNKHLNPLVHAIAQQKNIPVDELKPPKATWLGHSSVGDQKRRVRMLNEFYVCSKADTVLCFSKKGAAGISYKPVINRASENGLTVIELIVP